MNHKTPQWILLIEDNPVQSRVLQRKIESAGYGVDIALTGDQGLAKALERSYDLIVVDYFMPGCTGLDVMRSLSSRGPLPPLIMVTGSGSERTAVEAMKLGAKDFLVKDPDGHYLGLLPGVIARIIEEQRLLREKQESDKALLETQARYRSLFENIPIGLYQTTPEGRFIDANNAFIQMVGMGNLEELRRMNAGRLYKDSGDRTRWQENLASRRIIRGFEVELLRPDGTIVWVEDSARIVRDDSGNILFYEGSLQDITFRKNVERDLQRARDFYLALFAEFPAMIWRSGPDGRRNYFNRTWLEFTGMTEVNAKKAECRKATHPADRNEWEKKYLEAFKARRLFEMEYRMRRRDGVYRWVSDIARPFFDFDGRFGGYIGSCFDITAQKDTEEWLRHISHHDSLTRLYNRAYFEEEMTRAENGRIFPVSILMADVDGLKLVNDTLGHAEGDKLLVRAAEALRGVFRPSDAVARIGGDEFAVILPGMDSRVARGLVQRIRRRLKEYNRSVPGIPVGLSLGIATGGKGSSLSRSLKNADSRMYRDKKARAGRRLSVRKSLPAA